MCKADSSFPGKKFPSSISFCLFAFWQAFTFVVQAQASWLNRTEYVSELHGSPYTERTRWKRNAKPIIYIGVVLVQGDELLESIFQSGIDGANRVLSQGETLNAHHLEAIFEVLPRDNLFAATQKACKLLSRGIVALFGPRDHTLSQALLSLVNRFGVPYIETHWNLNPIHGAYSVSMHPKVQSFGVGLYEYVTRVEKWKRITLIQQNPESLLKFATLVNQFDGRMKVKTWDAGSTSTKAMMSALSTSNEKNFIVDIPSWQVRDFLVTAYVHNMTGPQYNYFFVDWDTSLIDLTSFKVDEGAEIKAISIMSSSSDSGTAPHDPIALNVFRPTKTPVNMDKPRSTSDSSSMMSTHFAFIYDSLLLLAHGLNTVTRTRPLLPQTLSCQRPPALWPLGLSLINAMKATPSDVVQGHTGPFRFDLEGLRTMFDLTFLELTEGGFTSIGTWNVDERIKMVTKLTKKWRKHDADKSIVLRVATVPDPPFMISIESDAYGNPLPNPEAWAGYCKDLLDGLAAEVGFNYTLRVPKDRAYGSSMRLKNGTIVYNGIMGELVRKDVDMAAAALTITYEREKIVDFSTPWMTIGGSILFTRPKSQKPSLFSFLQPLAPKVWLYVVAIYIAVCLCMFFAARLSPYEWKAPHPCDEHSDITKNQFTMLNSIYYYISALLNQGVELAPQATSTRLLTGVWWFFGLIIIATYTANLAAFLTVENTKSPIESAEDLANQEKIKYGTLTSGSSRDFFRTSAIPTFKKMGKFMDKYPDVTSPDTKTGIERVRKGGYAFILESSWNEYYVQRDCQLMQVGSLLDSKGYGIGFPQGSIWRDRISQAILKLQSTQVLAKLKRKWWTEFNISDPCTSPRDSNKAPSPLGVEQVGGVFIMLLVGFVLGFIVSVAEFVIATRDQKRSAILHGMWKELKFAARCLTTSKRLRSEIHKLPRSRSNIKLVSSIPGNMNVLDPKVTNQILNADSRINHNSKQPMLTSVQRDQLHELNGPSHVGSSEQTDMLTAAPPDYTVAMTSRSAQKPGTRRFPT